MTDLSDIRERWEKATSGPWASSADWLVLGPDGQLIVGGSSDAEAIAHVPSDIAALFARIEEQDAEIARHHADFERWEVMAAKGAEQLTECGALRVRLGTAEELLREIAEDPRGNYSFAAKAWLSDGAP